MPYRYINIKKSIKDSKQDQEEFKDTIEAIKIWKWKMDRQQNPQKTKYKRTNNDLQHTTQKTKDRVSFDFLKSNQNPYIDEVQTTQWPKEKVQKNKS